MPMTVQLTVPRLSVTPDAAFMREVGDFAIRLIRTRTERGQSVTGQPFTPLSEGYAKVKRAELGTDAADLTVSGRMLNDMAVVETRPGRVTLGFRSEGGRAPRGSQTLIQRSRAVGAQDKAFWHHVAGAGQARVRRPFFALSDSDRGRIRDRVATWLRGIVQDQNRK